MLLPASTQQQQQQQQQVGMVASLDAVSWVTFQPYAAAWVG
jgi:hypothetical protein